MTIQPILSKSENSTLQILVIGYGNTLRSDDGAGQVVAEAVAQWKLPNMRSLAVHQLTPELAEDLTTVDLAIFIDAYPAISEQDIKVSAIAPHPASMSMGHSMHPQILLAIAQAIYNYHPQAWLIAIPGKSFELGTGFSSLTEQGINKAIATIEQLR
jgi:hydrogenase maturation protease